MLGSNLDLLYHNFTVPMPSRASERQGAYDTTSERPQALGPPSATAEEEAGGTNSRWCWFCADKQVAGVCRVLCVGVFNHILDVAIAACYWSEFLHFSLKRDHPEIVLSARVQPVLGYP